MRLTHRYVLAFGLVVLVSGAVLAVTFDAHRTDITDNAEASVEDRAALSATMLDDRIREQQRTVSLSATNPDFAAHGTARQQRALETFVDRSAFNGVSIVGEGGVVHGIANGANGTDDVVGTDIGDRSYVQRALAGDQYISEPLRAATGNNIVVISAPIRDDGEIGGTVNGAYHLDETDLFDSLRGDEQTATTVETNGETLFSDAGRFEETVTATASLETVDWTVTAHRDQAAITTTITRLAVVQIFAGVALLGSVTAFGVWIYRSKIRRIGQLHERVRALERREYDAGPSIGGSDEWERIDDALTRLGATLARREQMLLVLNRILRHNLRNTLNVVIGHASQLEATLEGDDRESAGEIKRAARDLLELGDRARMTEDLLDPVAEEPPRTDIASVVRDRVAAVAHTAGGEFSIEDVTVTGPERAMAACGEEIAVAIDELLANALEHAGPRPTVAITIRIDDDTDRVLVRIDDDGPGIPADQISVIAGNRAISQINHTGGIGLWLVDWLLDRYDGRLVLPASPDDGPGSAGDDPGAIEPADRGATVVLDLPRATTASRSE